MKPLVAFIVGVLVASAATATAAKLLTGAQIKNGSITAQDLSKDVRAQLKKAGTPGATGAQGPKGAQGPPGEQGQTGAQGAPGANGSPDNAAAILTKLLTVDGADSSLDSDLLDGISSNAFALAATSVLDGDAANGGLTGTYPSPTIAPNAVNGARVADDSIGPADLTVVPTFGGRLAASPTTVVPAGGTFNVPLAEDFDVTAMHAAGSTDVVIARPGIYALTAQVTIDGTSGTGNVVREIRVGAQDVAFEQNTDADSDGPLATLAELAAGEIVTLQVVNLTSSPLTVFNNNTHLEVAYVSRG